LFDLISTFVAQLQYSLITIVIVYEFVRQVTT